MEFIPIYTKIVDTKKELDNEPVYDKEYLKIKIKSPGDEVTDFYNKKVPKVDFGNKILVTCFCNSCSEKESSKIKKVSSRTCNFISSSNNGRIIHINKHLSWLLFSFIYHYA